MSAESSESGHITVGIFGREVEVTADALRAAEGTLSLAWCHSALTPDEEVAIERAIDAVRRLRSLAGGEDRG